MLTHSGFRAGLSPLRPNCLAGLLLEPLLLWKQCCSECEFLEIVLWFHLQYLFWSRSNHFQNRTDCLAIPGQEARMQWLGEVKWCLREWSVTGPMGRGFCSHAMHPCFRVVGKIAPEDGLNQYHPCSALPNLTGKELSDFFCSPFSVDLSPWILCMPLCKHLAYFCEFFAFFTGSQ